MQEDSRKAREHQLVKQLYLARGTHELMAVGALLGLLLEEAKDRLVSSNPQEFMKQQGKALAYDELLRMLVRGKPEIPPKREE